jgi:hypothetical protein
MLSRRRILFQEMLPDIPEVKAVGQLYVLERVW